MKVSQYVKKLSVMELTITADLEDDPWKYGERFREDQLWPALMKYDRVCVIFDGVHKFKNLFIQQAFAELIVNGLHKSFLDKCLILHAAKPEFEETVMQVGTCIAEAEIAAKWSRSRLPPQQTVPYKEPQMYGTSTVIINESSNFNELPMNK